MKQKVQIKTRVFHITIRGWLIGYTGGPGFMTSPTEDGFVYGFFSRNFLPFIMACRCKSGPPVRCTKSFCLLYRHQFQWSFSSKPLPFCCDTPASGKMEEPAWPQSRKPRGLWKKDFEQFVVWGDRCECGAGWFIEVRGELKRPTRS